MSQQPIAQNPPPTTGGGCSESKLDLSLLNESTSIEPDQLPILLNSICTQHSIRIHFMKIAYPAPTMDKLLAYGDELAPGEAVGVILNMHVGNRDHINSHCDPLVITKDQMAEVKVIQPIVYKPDPYLPPFYNTRCYSFFNHSSGQYNTQYTIPQGDTKGCATLSILTLTELLKKNAIQLKNHSLLFPYDNAKGEKCFFFLPSPGTLAFSQSKKYIQTVRTAISQEGLIQAMLAESLNSKLLSESEKEANATLLAGLPAFRQQWDAQFKEAMQVRDPFTRQDGRNVHLAAKSVEFTAQLKALSVKPRLGANPSTNPTKRLILHVIFQTLSSQYHNSCSDEKLFTSTILAALQATQNPTIDNINTYTAILLDMLVANNNNLLPQLKQRAYSDPSINVSTTNQIYHSLRKNHPYNEFHTWAITEELSCEPSLYEKILIILMLRQFPSTGVATLSRYTYTNKLDQDLANFGIKAVQYTAMLLMTASQAPSGSLKPELQANLHTLAYFLKHLPGLHIKMTPKEQKILREKPPVCECYLLQECKTTCSTIFRITDKDKRTLTSELDSFYASKSVSPIK